MKKTKEFAYYRHQLDYQYPDQCDEHMITVKKLYDLNFEYLVNGGYRYGLGVRTMSHPHLGNSPLGEIGWDGACGCYILSDPKNHLSMYVARYVTPQYNFYHSPRLRNILYACIN